MPGNFFADTEQVAFCTQNIVPGIDFTNDPLLQGRNFSYLDTQLKRLGSPNFTHLPVNAPKCPIAHFQQDGHMAMANPQGRVNYEPNSADPPGPREDPAAGFRTYPDGQGDQAGPKRRLRPQSFADHYSQARQFFASQSAVEQQHIIDAFTFELSKCDKVAIRTKMVAGLRNVHEDLARSVAEGLGLAELPDSLPAAREPVRDLAPSPALSILANGPDSFAGRKLGILVTDGADAAKLEELTSAAEQAQVNVELIAPAIGGVETGDYLNDHLAGATVASELAGRMAGRTGAGRKRPARSDRGRDRGGPLGPAGHHDLARRHRARLQGRRRLHRREGRSAEVQRPASSAAPR
jgi:catalase